MSPRVACVLLTAGFLMGGMAPVWSTPVVRAGSAFISNDAATRTWSIGSAGVTLTLSLDRSKDFEIVQFASARGRPWIPPGESDSVIHIAGETLPFGRRASGFLYRGVTTLVRGDTVQLNATFDLPAFQLRLTRHYAATNGSPTFETWTTFTPLGGPLYTSTLNAFTLRVPAGRLRWVNGLRGEAADRPGDGAFTLREQDLQPGERLSLGAAGRSSEQTVPWFTIDGNGEVFYAGLLWSGAWSLTAERELNVIDLDLGLASMATNLMTAVEGPHAFFGIAQEDAGGAAAALRTFIVQGLREGRPIKPLVTYNTWFAYGVSIDERTMEREIDAAAALGAEVFVLDAGWYQGAGQSGAADYSSGLGSWQADSTRFPGGLARLANYARQRGLKFGLWVEPESVAQSTVGRPGLAQERWLARASGQYGGSVAAQVCLGGAVARQWVLDRLTQLLDDVRPDYLKWDNNMWINCDRSGHIHSSTDGNFAHVNGLYEILGALRERYPDLLIENVSGGGNRLDLGMLRYTDAAWMDDRSTPASVVRHNVQGLSAVFPPAYLLSFVMSGANESLWHSPDLDLSFRSRMLGALGLSFRTADFDAVDRAVMQREIRSYKALRPTLIDGTHTLLTPQAGSSASQRWDSVQTTSADGQSVLVWAFQSGPQAGRFTAKAGDLRARTRYEVVSVDRGRVAVSTGARLMDNGLLFLPSQNPAAHVLSLRPYSR
jgi:alpha-galactosidase